ncbi:MULTISPECIES: DUF1289 domain-containing protein [unclassified Sphingomonas]|uniref:DUF1289 domain-containing protein n=1 Tax=unclassified Sphingomonas TaxID=196159 RepID=UPI002150B4E2|nr:MULTISPECIES: DUF1289 domain-containing protein [unclassified Sphingomonas]MCR5870106.1 DUF1289 domain-containing protein [Sphingomonas sp. J344]UUX98203.1 DUF1289 domain-containing protein [Sphingomonas sp. J315]
MTAQEDEDDFLAFTPVPGIASPCIGVCRMRADNVCEGCHRTLDEIAEWFTASDDRRRAILARIATS